MKRCTKCGEIRPASGFGKDRRRKDGLQSQCKECFRERKAEYHLKNGDAVRKKHREYYAKNRERTIERVRLWRLANPEKIKAEGAVAHAKKMGRLIVEPCETCGSTENVDAHHDDYTKPLDVRWLCKSCHRRHHAKLNRSIQ